MLERHEVNRYIDDSYEKLRDKELYEEGEHTALSLIHYRYHLFRTAVYANASKEVLRRLKADIAAAVILSLENLG